MYPLSMVKFTGLDEFGLEIVIDRDRRRDDGSLGEFVGRVIISSPYVSGETSTRIGPRDLEAWQEFLDLLDSGSSASWRQGSRNLELIATPEHRPGDFWLQIGDPSNPGIIVTALVTIDDDWFDESYRVLDSLFGNSEPSLD